MASPRVQAIPGKQNNSHDVRLFNGVEELGLLLVEDNRLQEIPISEGARDWQREQKSWFSGMGKLRFEDDPNGYWDAYAMWTMTDGKLFPMPQWYWAKGYRSADYSMPGDVTYEKVSTYISIAFTASASYNADKMLLWLDWNGVPTDLTYRLCANSGGNPDTVLKSGTIAVTSATRYGPTEIDWATTQALTASTVYHLVIYNAGSANNYWRIATDADGAGSKTSADGSTNWTAATYSMYYRVVDADTKRRFIPFWFRGCQYFVTQNSSSSASTLYIVGDRFKATSATGTTVVNTSSGVSTGWTNDQWIGAWVRIIKGTGAGQNRQITDNDSTSLTVATWDITPSTDSECVIYATPIVQAITSGLGKVSGPPLVSNTLVYFPQGSTAIRKMALDYTNALQHKFADDSTNTADFLTIHHNSTEETEIWGTDNDLSKIKYSAEKTYAQTLSFSNWKKTGSKSYLTNILGGGDELLIFKEDGIWRVSPSRTILPYKSGLASAQDPSNGKVAFYANSELWFSWSNSLQRKLLDTDEVADMLLYRSGTQGLIRPGVPTHGISGIGWKFFAIDGGGTKTSSVIAHNGYGWIEIFRGWKTSARIQDLSWQSNPGTRPWLWCDVDGDLVYIPFPQDAANPRRDTSISYQHYAELETSTFSAGDETLYKLVNSIRLNFEKENSSIYVDYQADKDIGTSTWYQIGQSVNVQKDEFVIDLGEIRQFRLRFRMYTATATDPPVINAYSPKGWIFAPLKYMWVSSFRVDSNQITKRGSPDFSPDKIVDYLMSAHEKGTSISMRSVLPTMDSKSVIVSAPVIHREWTQVLNGQTKWGGYVDVSFREA